MLGLVPKAYSWSRSSTSACLLVGLVFIVVVLALPFCFCFCFFWFTQLFTHNYCLFTQLLFFFDIGRAGLRPWGWLVFDLGVGLRKRGRPRPTLGQPKAYLCLHNNPTNSANNNNYFWFVYTCLHIASF